MSGNLRAILARVADGAQLGEAEAEAAFEILMSGDATPSQAGAFLMALRVRGETIDEITGAARIMREKVLRIEAPADAIDTAGTGGDDKGTLNISTAAALLLAGAGVPVVMSGDATPSQAGAFLMALRVRGETIDEITGAARIMREKVLRIEAPADAIDTAGTGGDDKGTLNISTAAALLLAGAGVPVVKHGNRALSSRAGSSDVLAALGVDIDCDMALVSRALEETGICFLMAPRHHGAMRHVAGTRVELGTRTIFNLLGPLSNPAGARRQLVGVFAERWIEPLAHVLGNLGGERAWVVHGSDGMDELTTTGVSHVAELKGGAVRRFEVDPREIGLPLARPEDLQGGDPEYNAGAMRALLDGAPGPYRDIVVLNTAAALVVAERAGTLAEGRAQAEEAIDSGRARERLAELVRVTNSG